MSVESDSAPQPLPVDLAEGRDRVLGRLRVVGTPALFYPTIGSTNDVASALAAEGDRDGLIVTADAQTRGRGRRGRVWFSPPGAGLYVSVILNPSRSSGSPERATSILTLTAGVALAEGVEQATGLRPDIKWPNDLLIGRRKLAGILAEGVSTPNRAGVHAVVLGYGINVLSASFPPELADRVTSLESELGRPVDRAMIFGETLAALDRRYDDLIAARYDAILDAWRERAPGHRGARVNWDTPQGLRRGTTEGIDENGALVVRTADGVERLTAGEVRWD